MWEHLNQALLSTGSLLCGAIVVLIWLKPQMFPSIIDFPSKRISLSSQGQYTAMVVSTWAMVQLVVHDKLTEWFFAGYMLAWAGARFGSTWIKANAGAPRDDGKKDASKAK